MRLSLRFILPLILTLAGIAYAVTPLVNSLTLKWFIRDLDMRSQFIVNTMNDPLSDLIYSASGNKIINFFNRAIRDERLYALGFCNLKKEMQYKTQTFPMQLDCSNLDLQKHANTVIKLAQGALHITTHLIEFENEPLGYIVLVHDMSFIDKRSADTKKYVFYFFITLSVIISFITVVIAQLSWRGWINGIRALLRGEGIIKPLSQVRMPEILPLLKDLRALVRDLESNRLSKDEDQISWTPHSLKNILKEDLTGDEILTVSNRQPYIHNFRNEKIEIQCPASGLVTALEPIMRACSGTWIAHGSGSADSKVVDIYDRVQVPPENPAYNLRRIWLSKEEEEGYYYGFANEGIWPLCHIAHTRPIFRTSDWNYYVDVNKKFATVVIDEAKTEDPVVLVQDYHLALVPKLIQEKLPKATIITFWHIPWPNPEAFGICPWREEILDGLLGSSILGFHTAFHCHNFVDTIDRFLETRIDRDASTISYGQKICAVKNYPISIAWPPHIVKDPKSIDECRKKIRGANNLPENSFIGIGVDRLDYTKGILERFMAVERFLEKNPKWIGKFTFIQIAAPSRTNIEQYQHLEQQVRALVHHINNRFSKEKYQPICLKIEYHSPEQVLEYYRGSNICVITSLHDGMNLVAKEFVAARDDEQGVLILSQFTGASRELPESLIVNPYNIDQCAAAIQLALTMPPNEQRDRMRGMRAVVQEFNIYRWAGRMLIDAVRIRRRNRFMRRIRQTEISLNAGLKR